MRDFLLSMPRPRSRLPYGLSIVEEVFFEQSFEETLIKITQTMSAA